MTAFKAFERAVFEAFRDSVNISQFPGGQPPAFYFPDTAGNFPDIQNSFPDILDRELREKLRRRSYFLLSSQPWLAHNRQFPCKIPC